MKRLIFSSIWPRPFLLIRPLPGRAVLKSTPANEASRLTLQERWLTQRGAIHEPKRSRYLLSALPMLTLALVSPAGGQVIPAMKAPSQVSVFATFTDAKPDFRHWGDEAVYGFSAGGMIQSRHILGAELRGTIVRWGDGHEHQEYVLAGPRAALHVGRLSPYVSGLGGYAHAWEWRDMPRKWKPKPKLDEGFGPQWAILGGLDVHLTHHFSLRAGELGYSYIYANTSTMKQLSASAGIVYRLH